MNPIPLHVEVKERPFDPISGWHYEDGDQVEEAASLVADWLKERLS